MKIGTKLTISFSCILILMVMIAGLFLWSQSQFEKDSEAILHSYVEASVLKDISWGISRQMKDARDISRDSKTSVSEFLGQTDEVLYYFEKMEKLMSKELLSLDDSEKMEQEKSQSREVAELKQRYLSIVKKYGEFFATENSQKNEIFSRFIEKEFDGNLAPALDKALAVAEYESSLAKKSSYERQVFVEKASWGILAFGILSTISLSILISRKISEPIAKLKTAAEKIGSGDLQTKIEIKSKDEIGQLAGALQKMTDDLKKSMGTLNDELTWHTRVEGQYKQVAEKFEKVNNELKDFAYIVSHDLKAPLRGIKTIAGWLAEDYREKFDDNGKEQLKLLLSRVDRVHNLIEGVLQYSRIGRVKEQEVHVDLNEAAAEAIEAAGSCANIKVSIEDKLPEMICERTRITQLFGNLVNNSVKFMDKPQGWVKIRCEDKADYWQISVEDNGPGIEERHFEKIFKIFQTLSTKKDEESTGVGLSLVKKIVEMYGGKIWVESKVGQGSKFIFTLHKSAGAVNKPELAGAASEK